MNRWSNMKQSEDHCGSILAKAKRTKATAWRHSGALFLSGLRHGDEWVQPGPMQAGQQAARLLSRPDNYTHPDGAATWYSPHTHKNIPAVDKSVVRE